MAGQGIERREVLRVLALATVASQYSGFCRWVFAHAPGQDVAAQARASSYRPQFFSPSEYAAMSRLAELIIPSDSSPGAREAGVSEFIDFMAASDPNVQVRFSYGLRWLDAHARRLHDRPFIQLTAGEQVAMLEHLAYKDRHRRGEEEGRAFFKLLRDYTVMGFYTSRVGMEQLDCPALQAFYPELPGCRHADPEHRHLPPPQD